MLPEALGIGYEFLLFVSRVALCDKDKIDLFRRVAVVLYLVDFVSFSFPLSIKMLFGSTSCFNNGWNCMSALSRAVIST